MFYTLQVAISQSWEPDQQISAVPGAGTSENNGWCIAADANIVHAVWVDTRDLSDAVIYNRSADHGLTWTGPQRFTNKTGESFNPSVAASGTSFHVVWQDDRDGDWNVYYKRSPSGNAPGAYIWVDASGVNTTTISGNTIHDGAIIDRSGGNLWGAEDQIIENNIIHAGENSPIFEEELRKGGIVTTARSGTIRNNTIVTTGQVHGIYSSAGAPLHINNNTITLDEVQTPGPPDEGIAGIRSVSGWGTVTGNTVRGGEVGYYSKAGTVEFADNLIENSWVGFYSKGAEEVHHNIIRNCFSDGMILDGLKGPIHNNEVISNDGAGIRVTRVPIDLGGGADGSPGKNTLRGNGNYDLYVETVNTLNPVLFARYNFWDHDNANDIYQYDIRDGVDSTGLVTVDFSPYGWIIIFRNLCDHSPMR